MLRSMVVRTARFDQKKMLDFINELFTFHPEMTEAPTCNQIIAR